MKLKNNIYKLVIVHKDYDINEKKVFLKDDFMLCSKFFFFFYRRKFKRL